MTPTRRTLTALAAAACLALATADPAAALPGHTTSKRIAGVNFKAVGQRGTPGHPHLAYALLLGDSPAHVVFVFGHDEGGQSITYKSERLKWCRSRGHYCAAHTAADDPYDGPYDEAGMKVTQAGKKGTLWVSVR